MAEITASIVKALREETGLGMMDCKKALEQTGGDMQAAKDLLRKKGLATAEKKAARLTNEGLVVIRTNADKTAAAMVMVRCETDFCARNQIFRDMVNALADMAMQAPEGVVAFGDAMKARLQEAFAQISENMSYAQGVKIAAGRIGTYVHHNGKVGVLLGVDGEVSDQTLADLCMHIAFTDPMGISTKDIPAEVIAKEKEIAKAQAMESGKPEAIAEKMVVGKVNKFLEANAFIEQPFVRDDKVKVKDVLGKATVKKFARFDVSGK